MEIDIIEEEIELTKTGKIRKRKPKTVNQYFTEINQEAIIDYLILTDSKERNKIYNDKIFYSLYKLSENIIHTFKFYYTEVDDLEDLKFEVMSFTLEKLHLYDPPKLINKRIKKILEEQFIEYNDEFIEFAQGNKKINQSHINEFANKSNYPDDIKETIYKLKSPKAYSYFGTIIKRYLINYNKTNYGRIQRKTPTSEVDNDFKIVNDLWIKHENYDHTPSNFYAMYIKYMNEHIEEIFPDEEYLQIANIVLSLFKNKDNLEIIDKKSVFIYMKEGSGAATRHVSKVFKVFKKYYYELFQQYELKGYIS
jgi:hypothetical protein